jgi:TATA-box binding protein (TBP) (component of TFIID and TFIIIB)
MNGEAFSGLVRENMQAHKFVIGHGLEEVRDSDAIIRASTPDPAMAQVEGLLDGVSSYTAPDRVHGMVLEEIATSHEPDQTWSDIAGAPETLAEEEEAARALHLKFVRTNHNVTAHIGCSFGEDDFRIMAERCSLKTVWNTPYKNKKVTRTIITFQVEGLDVDLFMTGRMKCWGAATEEAAFTALQKVAEDIELIGRFTVFGPDEIKDWLEGRFPQSPTVTIIGTVTLGCEVLLNRLFEELCRTGKGEVKHNREGLGPCFVKYTQCLQGRPVTKGICKKVKKNPEATLMIFRTGKINVLGARTEDDVRAVLHTVQPALQQAQLLP